MIEARSLWRHYGDAVALADEMKIEDSVVRRALAELGREALAGCTLYTSTEPCAMCAGAIYWARVPTVVFGCSVHGLDAVTDGTLRMPCRQVFAHGARPIEVRGPVLEDEALEVHRAFWPGRQP